MSFDIRMNGGNGGGNGGGKGYGGVAAAVGVAAAAVVGIGVAAVGLLAMLSSDGPSSEGGKTMIAPGRGYRIYRKDFETDPARYFRDLRRK